MHSQRKVPDSQALRVLIESHSDESTRCIALIDPSRYPDVGSCVQALGMEPSDFEALPNLYAKYAKSIRELGPRLWALPDRVVPASLLEETLNRQAASFLVLPGSPAALEAHLASLVRMPQPDGGNLLFRFQDVVVLTALAPILGLRQREALLGPALAWLAVDLCQNAIAITRPERASGHVPQLLLDQAQIDALGDALAPLTVIHQANETDTTLLAGLDKCEQVALIRGRMQRARGHGLNRDEDIALYCVLSLQLPADFDRNGPVAEALQDARARGVSFGEAIDDVPVERWREWDEVLEREGYH